MRTATLSLLGLLLVAGIAAADDGVRWLDDYRQAAEIAARERKLILLHFESDDCAPCKRLEVNVFSQPEVATAMAANFVAVKVNVSRTPDLARRYAVASWPTDVVVTPMGQEVARQVSPQKPAEYIGKLKEIAARSGSGLTRSGGPSPVPAQPTGYQGAASKGKATPDLSSEFQAPLIENGAATTGGEAKRPGPPTGAPPTGFATQPQTNPYSPAPAAPNRSAAKPAAPVHNGSDYQPLEPIVNRTQVQENPTRENPVRENPAQDSLAKQQPANPATAPAVAPPVAPPVAPAVAQTQAPILPPLGMEGFCVVTLSEKSTWTKGDKKFGAVHRGRLYLFGNADAQKTFLADPDRFAPALSGYDPVIFNETQKLVDGKRAHGLSFNGQVYVFADETSLKKFEAGPKPYADTVYQAMLRSDQASSKIR